MEHIIQKHVDKQDDLEDRVFAEIDKVFESIDVAELMKDPRAGAHEIKAEVLAIIDKYSEEAVKNGVEVAGQFQRLRERGKDIVIETAESGDQNDDGSQS